MKQLFASAGAALIFVSAFSSAGFANAADAFGKTHLTNSFGDQVEVEFTLLEPGNDLIDYEAFGSFEGLGTGDYNYKVTDRKGLAKAAGEGVYPSTSVYRNPLYRQLSADGKLRGSHWDFSNIDNYQLMFYKWATAAETPGVKQYFTAKALEEAGFLNQAIKAYHAVIVHFPKQTGMTIWHTPIYYASRAIDKIEYLTRTHPELKLKYVDYQYLVKNGDNLETNDDIYEAINPGRILNVAEVEQPEMRDLASQKVIKKVGGDHVALVQYENMDWQIQVDGKPMMVKAIAYEPTPIGQSAHNNTRTDWMQNDQNKNGKIDGPYESWVDENKNNQKDPGENVVGDFTLLKQMGVNAFRHYHGASNKELLRDAYENYGIMSIVGDMLGMYAVGSGADWHEGTDYTNPEHQKAMKESVRKMVMEHKDEPYLLFWVLSNEGNYGFKGDPEAELLVDRMGLGSNGKKQYREMYTFANEVAQMIKELDPNHPVAFSNGETIFIQTIGEVTPDIDIFGANAYRGKDGFGYSFWNDVKRFTGKAAFLTEFGCPAFHNRRSLEEAEVLQMEYLKGNWEDIFYNRAGSGIGNSIGGTLFQFIDEWWKAGPPPEFDPFAQETVGDFKADFPDGWMHEEWLGVTSQGDGTSSPFLRQLRQSYKYFQKAWNQPDWN
ncbi:MAG: hypothetical protein KC649_00015 [Candidatus Omnitrophica bacterium]|nr:hypothetical protein [Candidatus Omnitrophota bacterium]